MNTMEARKTETNKTALICPDCNSQMHPEGGCAICIWCGYSPCK